MQRGGAIAYLKAVCIRRCAVPDHVSPGHAVVAVAAAAAVTAARQALLQTWPDFAAASQRSNHQVHIGSSCWF